MLTPAECLRAAHLALRGSVAFENWAEGKRTLFRALEIVVTSDVDFSSTVGMAQGPRLSGLARQALSLHRALLRAARMRPEHARAAIVTRIRAEFDRRRALDPTREIQQIEHFLRHGRKQLERLMDPNVKAVAGGGSG